MEGYINNYISDMTKIAGLNYMSISIFKCQVVASNNFNAECIFADYGKIYFISMCRRDVYDFCKIEMLP